jgi:hypothetical protein
MPLPTTTITDLPSVPAVYAMYGGQGRSQYVAYVGLAGKLRGRIEQHLVRRDSSVTTGVSAVSLNPECVTQVRWWQHPDFEKQDILKPQSWWRSTCWSRRCGAVVESRIGPSRSTPTRSSRTRCGRCSKGAPATVIGTAARDVVERVTGSSERNRSQEWLPTS